MANPNFIRTELPSPITEWAVPLASQKDGAWWASGTAVIVAPFLAVTAKHVIEDHWNRQEGPMDPAGGHGDLSMVAVQIPEGGQPCLWAVRKVWRSAHTDIAFLKLEPWNEGAASHEWKRWVTLNVAPPEVGSAISAFGYHSSTISGGDPIRWAHEASNSFGRVQEVFLERRDRVRLDFPCLSVDAQFEGGMSGGPAFNEAGELCGLVCSSLPPYPPETQHTSYVTLLWPALGVILDLPRKGYPEGEYAAIELARGGQMVVRNWERVDVVISEPNQCTVGLRAASNQQRLA